MRPQATGSSRPTADAARSTLTKALAARSVTKPPKPHAALPLWGHQRETIEFATGNPHVFDTSDPGTGKTRAHIETFATRRRCGGGKALIIAPKTILEPAWLDDFKKFAPDMLCSVAFANNRAKAFEAIADVYITNTDAVKWLVKRPKKFFKDFDTLIIDESHYFKHRTSGRSKAIAALKDHFQYRTLMTGTPFDKSVTELWHQVFILDNGQRLGKNFYSFRQAVCEPTNNGFGIVWNDKENIEAVVTALLQDVSIRHKFENVFGSSIPANHKQVIKISLSDKAMRAYEELAANAILELQKDDVTAVNAAALRTKLLQVASGAVYADNSVQLIDTERYELVLDLVEARHHSVVFFLWEHQKKYLIEHAKKRKISYAVIESNTSDRRRAEIVEQYQAGHFQTIFLHPKTGAHGLTLTKGTATIWPSPVYEPGLFKQGLHRVYRGGQTQATETILIQARGTVEARVYEILENKNARMTSLLEMLQG